MRQRYQTTAWMPWEEGTSSPGLVSSGWKLNWERMAEEVRREPELAMARAERNLKDHLQIYLHLN